ncbi:type II toxin-antitoxin system RelE/ParE family toxin [Streptomyces sp. PD-S100-1]|uniref:type II toxin-antitoxin system RelE/ParE family toxin n=1 Tax=Streptomyces sp. PD-S100-1 TaxID=3394351 RepID=UPI0039BD83CD
MSEPPWAIEIEPEVQDWLDMLSDADYAKAERVVDRLLPNPINAAMPFSKPLGDKVHELRFSLGDIAVRIPYWLAPGRRIVLLTVFRKTRMNEHMEVSRAKDTQKACETEHDTATHIYDRNEADS